MQKRRLSQNEQGIIGIILVIAFIVGLVFLRDILVKRGVRVVMLTELDYMNAAEYYMQKNMERSLKGSMYWKAVYMYIQSQILSGMRL